MNTTATVKKYRQDADGFLTKEYETTNTYPGVDEKTVFQGLAPLLGSLVNRTAFGSYHFAATDNGPVEYFVTLSES